jgi:hypothetical protein
MKEQLIVLNTIEGLSPKFDLYNDTILAYLSLVRQPFQEYWAFDVMQMLKTIQVASATSSLKLFINPQKIFDVFTRMYVRLPLRVCFSETMYILLDQQREVVVVLLT